MKKNFGNTRFRFGCFGVWIGLFFMVPSAFADDWTETARENNCIFYQGKSNDGITPIRAVCNWKIPVQRLDTLLAKTDHYDDYFSGLAHCEAIKGPSGISRVLQIHEYSGLSPRAAYIDYRTQKIPNGTRYTYQKATDQTQLEKKYIEINTHTGHWDVMGNNQKSTLIFESRYSAGGFVPNFLIRWFQGAGTRKVLSELKKYAERK